MEQAQRLPSGVRIAFLIHLIVAIVIGAFLLISPLRFVGIFGYPADADFRPLLRAFGSIILVLGGVTSLYGLRTTMWAKVDYIVRAEISDLAVQTLVFLFSLIFSSGPAAGNIAFGLISLALCLLFVWAWSSRPRV